ncbi:hypothetical protein TNCT_325991 [Trichonephila clavata]|uniref:Uncharacterized protein n=1 Tax=Trichonephila clavata TaxID=2740835 RepID=A0A8X6FNL9_TRICU|nr:hypothetical protein TNCT_325991 [Trichonephila clavata]
MIEFLFSFFSRICHSGGCIINSITSTSTTDGAANQTEDAEPDPHGNRSRCPDNASVLEKDKQVADLERGFVAEVNVLVQIRAR